MIATLLVEDQHLLREGLKLVLQADPEIWVVAEADSADQALVLLQQRRFDALVLDLSLPDMDGLEFLAQLPNSVSHPPILVVTMHQSPQVVERALKLGAQGYVLKSASPQELRTALRQVAQGHQYLQASLRTEPSSLPHPQLSRHERQLLQLAHQGLACETWPTRLQLSPTTVQSLLKSLLRKLESPGLEQALEQARRLGLVLSEPHPNTLPQPLDLGET